MIRKALAFFAAAFVAMHTCLAYETARHTNSVERENVTYAQRGGMDSSTYVVTNVGFTGSARTLPKYLHYIETDDTYPEDAAWYYSQPQDYGSCSAVRDGNYLYRNLDWLFNYAADFIVKVSAADGRFASVGVANCGMHLSEDFVCSHKPSRYYKCLAGRVMDGINENGVVAEINVVGGDPNTSGWHTNSTSLAIHPLGAVRWSLDNGSSALDVATNLAARIRFPQGWEQNFHYMVADGYATYIVENGAWKKVTGRAVMTNFPLLPSPVRGEGYERYTALMRSSTSITNVWYTRAYSRDTSWVTDFYDDEDIMEAAKDEWDRQGSTKEQHRGKTAAGKSWWQTVHTSIYDFQNRTLRISVQETDDWYVFGVMSADKLGAYRKIRGLEIDDCGDLSDDENIDTYVAIGGNYKGYDSGIEISAFDQSHISMWGYFGSSNLYQNLYIEPSGIAFEHEDEQGEWHSFIGYFTTNENDSGVFVTDKTVSKYEKDSLWADWTNGQSVALGYVAHAVGPYSLALGWNPIAYDAAAIAIGAQARALNETSIAVGYQAQSSGWGSGAFGNVSKAQGSESSAVGYNAQAYGSEASAFGTMAIAMGNRSVAVGDTVIAEHDNSIIIGTGSYSPQSTHGTNTLNFALTDDPKRIYFNNKTLEQIVQQVSPTITEEDPVFTQWKNANSTALGQSAKAGTTGVSIGSSANTQGGLASVAVGTQAKARENYSVAIGYGAEAKGIMSVAIGESAYATNFASVAIGAGTDEIKAEIVRSHGNGTFNIGAKSLDKVWLGETNLLTLVQKASPPVELPDKWALANVTNANGQAVGAADVGALPTTGGMMTGDLSIKDNTAIIFKTYDDDEDSMIHLVDSMYGMEFLSRDSFYFNYRLPSGWMYLNGQRVALENSQSLAKSFTDATTNSTADSECISTNICKLIAPHIEPVNVIAELYDGTKKVLWSVTIDNGDMKYGAKTNVDTTAYMQANSVLKDKALNTNWKVRIEDSEMKFDAIVRQ